MENLFPALVAVLAGLIYLYRTRTSSTAPPKTISPPTPEEVEIVSKESDFPPDWLTSNHLFELERRAIFSKVCQLTLHPLHPP